jgi:hypothetical protein
MFRVKNQPSKKPVCSRCLGRIISDSDLFQTVNGYLPRVSVTTTIQHTNTQVTYTQIHISHKITPLKTSKLNKEKQMSSHSNKNNERHMTVNAYSVENGKEIKLSLIQAFEAY